MDEDFSVLKCKFQFDILKWKIQLFGLKVKILKITIWTAADNFQPANYESRRELTLWSVDEYRLLCLFHCSRSINTLNNLLGSFHTRSCFPIRFTLPWIVFLTQTIRWNFATVVSDREQDWVNGNELGSPGMGRCRWNDIWLRERNN